MIRKTVPRAELRVYGRSTAYLKRVMDSLRKSKLSDAVHYLGPKNLQQIAEAIGQCDVGIIPNRRSIFTEINMPTRIFEYLSQGKPVIAPRTQGILDYFKADELVFFELGDATDLAAKIEYVFSHPQEMATIVDRGQGVYLVHRWETERRRFVNLVVGLLSGKCSAANGRIAVGKEPEPQSSSSASS
jgi:glycosyltransferase involved in cell wall biosynthesis